MVERIRLAIGNNRGTLDEREIEPYWRIAMVTLEQLRQLSYRDNLHHVRLNNSDKTPVRCRVNGALKTWKTRPDDFRLPVKYGLYECFYITPANAAEWMIG